MSIELAALQAELGRKTVESSGCLHATMEGSISSRRLSRPARRLPKGTAAARRARGNRTGQHTCQRQAASCLKRSMRWSFGQLRRIGLRVASH